MVFVDSIVQYELRRKEQVYRRDRQRRTCGICVILFPSRNQLFQHLEDPCRGPQQRQPFRPLDESFQQPRRQQPFQQPFQQPSQQPPFYQSLQQPSRQPLQQPSKQQLQQPLQRPQQQLPYGYAPNERSIPQITYWTQQPTNPAVASAPNPTIGSNQIDRDDHFFREGPGSSYDRSVASNHTSRADPRADLRADYHYKPDPAYSSRPAYSSYGGHSSYGAYSNHPAYGSSSQGGVEPDQFNSFQTGYSYGGYVRYRNDDDNDSDGGYRTLTPRAPDREVKSIGWIEDEDDYSDCYSDEEYGEDDDEEDDYWSDGTGG